jgi:tetratricopeptide (TPR) repeat protein
LEKAGKIEEAIADWTKLLDIYSYDPKAFCKRGLLLIKIGEKEKALTDLKKGLKHKNQLYESLRIEAEENLKLLEEEIKNKTRGG